jgi:ABC-2 type transport system ATP-binding protein
MSTHTLKVAEDVCDRFGIIYQGTLLTTGTADMLREKASLAQADLEDVFIKLTSENPNG